VANGTPGSPGGDDANTITASVNPVTGGSNTYAVTAVFSKPVLPQSVLAGITTPANWVVKNPSVAGSTIGILANFSADPATPSAVSFTATATTPAEVVVHGTSTLTYNGVAHDFAGNAMTVPATVTL
jgi:hypothetical protein